MTRITSTLPSACPDLVFTTVPNAPNAPNTEAVFVSDSMVGVLHLTEDGWMYQESNLGEYDPSKVADADADRETARAAVRKRYEMAREVERRVVEIRVRAEAVALQAADVAREHELLCHSDGSTCEDGCDAAPLKCGRCGATHAPDPGDGSECRRAWGSPLRLYWFMRHSTKGPQWTATTAPATDAERERIERMGYPTRVTVGEPTGQPTDEEMARVHKWTPELARGTMVPNIGVAPGRAPHGKHGHHCSGFCPEYTATPYRLLLTQTTWSAPDPVSLPFPDETTIAECATLEQCSERLVEADRLYESRRSRDQEVQDGDPTWLAHYEDAGFYVQRTSDGALFTMQYSGQGPFEDPAEITWIQHSGT